MIRSGNLSRVLLIDDNPVDQESVIRAFRKVDPSVSIEVLETGSEAFEFIHEISSDAPVRAAPEIVLLDLKLDAFDGLEILKSIKGNELLSYIPVIIFSSSRSRHDIKKSYRFGANAFATKPHSFDGLVETMESIVGFWGGTAELPYI